MVLCMPYTLVLNEPSIIFIPPPDVDLHSDYNDCDDEERAEAEAVVEELTPGHRPFAMQVIIKQAGKRYLSELLVYFAAQREIVKAIETLVVREARGEYVPAMIQIEGEELGGRRYLLTGGE
ncbi:hypothetical protein CC1G_03501 [Coprinopsis cinerea okayama7|uniref:Uncharacterized protein n=1 Tax=Coprinopsis cinerea (strain Okayama-7 / 130 / ATCC MYA-4618 / FGSC 9003) TaxID=240176 RepID=A8NCE3_COPC7|nr:hypothetical protein CC1G_03501 [Coprinopsis cinerea okayama7\|eukprot:XP_001832487.1 hypothetical protein CC1G_03501 [Coprinopsis cinerea okayama7\